MLHRLKRRIVDLTSEADGRVSYTVVDSEATPSTNGRKYSMSAEAFHDDYAAVEVVEPAPEPEPEPVPEPSTATPLYATDFESDDTNANGFAWGSVGSRVTPSTDRAYSGSRSLRFRYGPDAAGRDSSAEQRFVITPDAASAPKEVWVEYAWYVPANYQHRADQPANNKFMTLWAEEYSDSGGAQFFLGLERQTDTTSRLDILEIYGGDYGIQPYRYRGFDFITPADFGKWMNVRIHARIAVDGFVRVYKNGTLHVETGPRNLAHVNGSRDYFRHGYLMGWSNSGYTDETDFFIDDFKLYTADPGWVSG